LVARGASAADVAVTGIPVSGKFALPTESGTARRHLGLRDDTPVLLVVSGGFGVGPVAGILDAANRVETRVQVVVVCGRNEQLRRELAVLNHRHPTRLLGFVSNMHEFMAAADLVVTKPGGLTSSEALAIGRPLLIVDPIPGQEAANSDFLLEHGTAVKVNRVEDIPYRLDTLLGSRRLKQMSRAARRLGRPGAARAVCEAALDRLTHRSSTAIASGNCSP
jgi:processive 1,2-diacylglycerol beta-glucosyltransferase